MILLKMYLVSTLGTSGSSDKSLDLLKNSEQKKNKTVFKFILCLQGVRKMSEKQIFNKDYQLAKMAEKRRNRWKTRDYLVNEIDRVMTKLGDANWIMYQVLKNEPQMSHKSRVKLCRWLAINFYNVEKYFPITDKPQEPQETEQLKLLKETLVHLKTFWNLTSSKKEKIIFSSKYAYELNNFISSASILTKRIEKEIKKNGVQK